MPESGVVTDPTMSNPSRHILNPSAELGLANSWDGTRHNGNNSGKLVSLFADAPHFDIKRFLHRAYGRERFYWSEPSIATTGGLTIAGIGIAAEVFAPPILENEGSSAPAGYRFDEIERRARLLFAGAIFQHAGPTAEDNGRDFWHTHPARPRLFGGFAFQDDFIPDNTWSVFSPAQFVIPHFQVVQSSRQTFMTINTFVGEDEDVAESLAGLKEALMAQIAAAVGHSQAKPLGRPMIRYPMPPETWKSIVNRAACAIQEGLLEKVVLSRVCEVRSNEPIDGAATLDYLNKQYSDCYRFLFEPAPYHAFFGATPELLVRKNGDRMDSMALAGSIARGRSPAEDHALAGQLLDSTKDRHEHQLVTEAILLNLQDMITDLSVPPEPVVLSLQNIQHLLTPIQGRVKSDKTSTLTLTRRLHPTPAMGGVPAGDAMVFLRENEPVPRGWYAAPIGWIDSQGDGVFAVAIRSAVTQHNRAWLYAGAGIVEDSQAENEWAETALKFLPMLGALGIEGAV